MVEITFTDNHLHNLIALHSVTFAFLMKNNLTGKCTSTEIVNMMKLKGADYLEFIVNRFRDNGIISDESV